MDRTTKINIYTDCESYFYSSSFITLFGVANVVYNAQEFGNLPFIPAQKQNMEHIQMQLETELSNKSPNACVYYNKDVNDIKRKINCPIHC